MDLQALRKGTVKEVTAKLPDLTDDQLVELNALEAQDASPRKGLLDAILAERNSRQPGDDDATQDGGARDASLDGGARPAWQGEDYTGPLTADQAAWRNARIKPDAPARTK